VKKFEILFAFFILFITAPILLSRNETSLQAGDLVFVSLKTQNKDGFVIHTNVTLAANTIIRFTDSEWNGDYFHYGEGDLVWNSGENITEAGSIIEFTNVNLEPSASLGKLSGFMAISKEEDAVFAYIGNYRMPTKFISAAANEEEGFGTLIKTDLELGSSAFLLP
jgi:hypothetical protein